MQPIRCLELRADEFSDTSKKPQATSEHRNAEGDVAYSFKVLNGGHECELETLFMSVSTP